ncbi:hypothetical protein ACFQV8_11685 [Pseudonocardia benzenivorans]
MQRADFVELLTAMDGLPTTIRLLDPPLHEFLPDRTELAVKVAVAKATGDGVSADDERLLAAVERLHEANRCSAAAVSGSGCWSRGSTACRSGRSPRPRPSARSPAATRGWRSWSRSSDR